MNAFWVSVLTAAIKILAGSGLWDAALRAVTHQLSTELSGEEKRRAVQADLREAFAQVSTRTINLVIEIALAKIQPK